MAVLQLSRITHRKGLAENLPQLAGAELGWVLDERRLFIGNGTIVDGAPVIGNTEILTEFSDILGLSSTYTYKGTAAGYVVATSEAGEDIVRSLQSKFDDMASVKDFGAVGDGATDDTNAINRALFELFCREVNPEVRRSLFFPAGTYIVSDSIKIPPHAKLYGEGLTSSIIKYQSPADVLATNLVVGKRYAITTTGTTDFTLVGAANSIPNTIFTATAAGTGDGTAREVYQYVVETADALQQTGGNIGNNGAENPTGIEMVSMAVHSTEENTLLKLDSITDSGFHYIGLQGPVLSESEVKDTNRVNTAAVEIASTSAISNDVTLSKINSKGTKYGLIVNDEVKGVVFENSNLQYHFMGCAIGETPVGTGPTGVVITRNIFDNIPFQGILFGNVLFNSSSFNVFYDVGNNYSSAPVSSVIQMLNANCVSVGDLFERSDIDDQTSPRISLEGNGGIAIDSAHSIHLGSYERQVGIEATLDDTATAGTTIFVLNDTTENSYKVDYSIKRGTATRMGQMYVSVAAGVATYNDEFTESSDTGVILDVTATGTDSDFNFTITPNGTDATINYSVVILD